MNTILWGLFEEGLQNNSRNLEAVIDNFSRKPDIIMWYCDLLSEFPLEACRRLNKAGIMPHIVWEPWYFGDITSANLDRILEGEFDTAMSRFFSGAEKYGSPFFLRWGHEMNGNWYPWSGSLNGNRPDKYREAFRYVRNLAKKAGVCNPVWVWSPANDTVPGEGPDITEYYPGNDYVDWIGIDGYNWGTGQPWGSRFLSFEELFIQIYNKTTTLYPHKPLMVAEFGSSSAGGDKTQWINQMFHLLATRFNKIQAFIYFNINKETDWSLFNSPEDLQAFRNGLNRLYIPD